MNQARIVTTYGLMGVPYFDVITDEGFDVGGSSDWYEALSILALFMEEQL